MKHIILDCDDVLLDFMPGVIARANALGIYPCPKGPGSFDLSGWLGMEKSEMSRFLRDYIDDEDSSFGDLPPIPGAVEGVQALKDAGFQISVMSSFSDQKGPHARRMGNLDAHFGSGTFVDLYGLALGSSKYDALVRMTPSIFVDDLFKNAEEGLRAGHAPLWMKAHHNVHEFDSTEVPAGMRRAWDWDEILQITLGNEHAMLPTP